MRPERLRIVLGGMVADVPGHGGFTWAVLNWLLGLRSLGHDVLLVDEVDEVTPSRRAYFDHVARVFGLHGHAALVARDGGAAGLPRGAVAGFAASADVLVNLGGQLRDPEVRDAPGTRAFVDLDPGYTQVWQELYGIDQALDAHTHFVTVGLNVGRPDCPIPTCGKRWITTLPPVHLPAWEPSPTVRYDAWTTVANWRGYGTAEVGGVRWGQKAHTWRELLELPRIVPDRFAPALAIHPDEHKDLAALAEHGWELLDPGRVAATPGAYRRFVRGSRGELGIAKEGYVVSGSGWFSDRSACYLAAGRPVVAQDTGWTAHLDVPGLLAFSNLAEAAARLARQRTAPTVPGPDAALAFDAARLCRRVLDGASTTPEATTDDPPSRPGRQVAGGAPCRH